MEENVTKRVKPRQVGMLAPSDKMYGFFQGRKTVEIQSSRQQLKSWNGFWD